MKCQLTLLELLEEAYQVKAIEIAGPRWLDEDVFAFQAIVPSGTTKDIAHLMLQNALSDRFKLIYHRETRPIHVYALLPGKQGLKLQTAADPDHREKDKVSISITSQRQIRAAVMAEPGHFYAVGISLDGSSK